jgi:hypothetical protein
MSTSTIRKWNYNWKCMPHVTPFNSHYMPLLVNLVENCSTNLVEGCCQLNLTSELHPLMHDINQN